MERKQPDACEASDLVNKEDGRVHEKFGGESQLLAPSDFSVEGKYIVFSAPSDSLELIKDFNRPMEDFVPEDHRGDQAYYKLTKAWRSNVSEFFDFSKAAIFEDVESMEPVEWVFKEADGVIDAVRKLKRGKEKAIIDFIRRFGPLWVCSSEECKEGQVHFLPPVKTEKIKANIFQGCRWNLREPLDAYVRFGKLVDALLWLLCYARSDEEKGLMHLRGLMGGVISSDMGIPTALEIWGQPVPALMQVREEESQDEKLQRIAKWWVEKWGSHRNAALRLLGAYLSERLLEDHAKPTIYLADRAPGGPTFVTSHGFGIVSTVWLELAMLMVGAERILICSRCHFPYVRPAGRKGKLPRPGENNYCPDCRNKRRNTGGRGGKASL